ncbi:myb family dna-binding domain-containing protein [Cystoisospora suis]|uniref:Myb family dna-binding domain-containing protein n=1 Tax=Cystoisospora suis TaxID=483139 RepID=A0A2C6L4E8_9APIC|nr:myb family dna-binding domain-containing protein [Cystoisospora suis]
METHHSDVASDSLWMVRQDTRALSQFGSYPSFQQEIHQPQSISDQGQVVRTFECRNTQGMLPGQQLRTGSTPQECRQAGFSLPAPWPPVPARASVSISPSAWRHSSSAEQRGDVLTSLRDNYAQMSDFNLRRTPTLDELLPTSQQRQLERFVVLCRLQSNVSKETDRLRSMLQSMRAQCTRLTNLQRVRGYGVTRRRRGRTAGVREEEDEAESEDDEEDGTAKPVSLLLNETGQQLPSNSDAIYIWTHRHRLEPFGKVPSKAELRATSAALAAVASVSTAAGEKRNTALPGICSDPGWASAVLRWQLDRLKVKRRKITKRKGSEERVESVTGRGMQTGEAREDTVLCCPTPGVDPDILKENTAAVAANTRVYKTFVRELYKTLSKTGVRSEAIHALFTSCRLQAPPVQQLETPPLDPADMPPVPYGCAEDIHPQRLLWAARYLLTKGGDQTLYSLMEQMVGQHVEAQAANAPGVSSDVHQEISRAGDAFLPPGSSLRIDCYPANRPSFSEVLRSVCHAVSTSLAPSVWAATPAECLLKFVNATGNSLQTSRDLAESFLPRSPARGQTGELESRPEVTSTPPRWSTVPDKTARRGTKECRLLFEVEDAIVRGVKQLLTVRVKGRPLTGSVDQLQNGSLRLTSPEYGNQDAGTHVSDNSLSRCSVQVPSVGCKARNYRGQKDCDSSLRDQTASPALGEAEGEEDLSPRNPERGMAIGRTIEENVRAALQSRERADILLFASFVREPIPPFSVFQVYIHLRRSLQQTSAVVHRRWWSPEEDAALLNAVEKMGVQQKGAGKWMRVAAQLFGRTNNQCRARYLYLSVESKRHGLFTALEDVRLQLLVCCYGRGSWGKIARHLRGRTEMKCRERYENCLHEDVKTLPWSASETAALRAAVQLFGKDWSRVGSVIVGRSADACRRKYEEIEVELELEARTIDLLQTPKTGLASESTEVKQVRLHLVRLTSLILGCCHYRFFSLRLRRTVRRGRYAEEAAKLIDFFDNKRGGRVRLEDKHFDAAPFLRSSPRPRASSDQPDSCLGASSSPLLSIATGSGSADAVVGEDGRAKLRGQRRVEGRGTRFEDLRRRKPCGETLDQETEATPRAAVMALIRHLDKLLAYVSAKQDSQYAALAQAPLQSAAGTSAACYGMPSPVHTGCSTRPAQDVAATALSEGLLSALSPSGCPSPGITEQGDSDAPAATGFLVSRLAAQRGIVGIQPSALALADSPAAISCSDLSPSLFVAPSRSSERISQQAGNFREHSSMSRSVSSEPLSLVLPSGSSALEGFLADVLRLPLDRGLHPPRPSSETCARWPPMLRQAVAVTLYLICLLEKVFCLSLGEYILRPISMEGLQRPSHDRAGVSGVTATSLLRHILPLGNAGSSLMASLVEPHCREEGPRDISVTGSGCGAVCESRSRTARLASDMCDEPASPTEPCKALSNVPPGCASSVSSPTVPKGRLGASSGGSSPSSFSSPDLCLSFLPSLLRFILSATRADAGGGTSGHLAYGFRSKQQHQSRTPPSAALSRKLLVGASQLTMSGHEAGARGYPSNFLALDDRRKMAVLRALRGQGRPGMTRDSGFGRPALRCLQQKQLPTTLVEAATKAAAEQLRALNPRRPGGPHSTSAGQISVDGDAADASCISTEKSSPQQRTDRRRRSLLEKGTAKRRPSECAVHATSRSEFAEPGRMSGRNEGQGDVEAEPRPANKRRSKDSCQRGFNERKGKRARAAPQSLDWPGQGNERNEPAVLREEFLSEVNHAAQSTQMYPHRVVPALQTVSDAEGRKPTMPDKRVHSSHGSVAVGGGESEDRVGQAEMRQERRIAENRTESEIREEPHLEIAVAFDGVPVRIESGESPATICDQRVVGFPVIDGISGKRFTKKEAWQMVQAVKTKVKKGTELQVNDGR